MTALHSQLPADFVRLANELSLSRRTWQLYGMSHAELMAKDLYEQEMIKIAVALYG